MYSKWDFWFENKPFGNPESSVKAYNESVGLFVDNTFVTSKMCMLLSLFGYKQFLTPLFRQMLPKYNRK
jgi:hypothetical protein